MARTTFLLLASEHTSICFIGFLFPHFFVFFFLLGMTLCNTQSAGSSKNENKINLNQPQNEQHIFTLFDIVRQIIIITAHVK